MHPLKEWHNNILGEKVVKALEKNNFQASYFDTREEAIKHIYDLIPEKATIGIGGSWTLNELNLPSTLEKDGFTLFNHNKPGLSPAESLELRRKQLTCDVFISSTNAVTQDGKLVNTDGSGNRVAAMIFGPKKAIIVTGINKVVKDVSAAEARIKETAAPINNKRLAKENPCVLTGSCMDCMKPSRICNVTTVMHKKPSSIEMHIVIIGEELGF